MSYINNYISETQCAARPQRQPKEPCNSIINKISYLSTAYQINNGFLFLLLYHSTNFAIDHKIYVRNYISSYDYTIQPIVRS